MHRKHNIALFSHTPHMQGAEKMLLEAAKLLKDSEDYHPILFIPGAEEGVFKTLAIEKKIQYVSIPFVPWYVFNSQKVVTKNIDYSKNILLVKDKIKEVLVNYEIDAIINNTLTSIVPVLCAIELDLPVISWVHGIWDTSLLPEDNYSELILNDMNILSLSTKNLCCSNWTANYYKKLVPQANIKAFSNWSSNAPFVKPYSSSRTFVCLNSDEKHKGIDTLINAVNILTKTEDDFCVLLYGSGPEYNYLKSLVDKYELNNYIIFKERIVNTSDAYNSCCALIQPSYLESFGLTITEAMAHKRPVIATRSGGPEEIVIDGETGFLVECKNAEILSEKMKFILNNEKEAKKMGEAGYIRFCEHFSPQAAKKRLLDELDDLFIKFKGYDVSKRIIYNNILIPLRAASQSNQIYTPSQCCTEENSKIWFKDYRRICSALGYKLNMYFYYLIKRPNITLNIGQNNLNKPRKHCRVRYSSILPVNGYKEYFINCKSEDKYVELFLTHNSAKTIIIELVQNGSVISRYKLNLLLTENHLVDISLL